MVHFPSVLIRRVPWRSFFYGCVVIQAKPHTSHDHHDHTAVVIDCWLSRYCSGADKLCFFCSSRSKLVCESPSGLTTSPPPFFPSGLLRLHCMPLTFSPCSLKSRVSGEPIWPEVSLSKRFFGLPPLASHLLIPSVPLQTTPPRPLTGLNPPPQRQHCSHYRDRVTNRRKSLN